MAELKPCPFCGGEANITTKRFSPIDTGWRVYCGWCQAYIQRWAKDEREAINMAIEAWNRRAEE